MLNIGLPDGSERQYPGPLSVAEVAQSIGPGLAKDIEAAQSGQTIHTGGGGDPAQVTKSVLAQHPDARYDKASGTLTLPGDASFCRGVGRTAEARRDGEPLQRVGAPGDRHTRPNRIDTTRGAGRYDNELQRRSLVERCSCDGF